MYVFFSFICVYGYVYVFLCQHGLAEYLDRRRLTGKGISGVEKGRGVVGCDVAQQLERVSDERTSLS